MPHPPPLEISEAIIDYLHSDVHALRACSLTCKSWVPASRTHIFSRIHLYPWNFENFLDVLQSSTSPGRYVRELTLTEGRKVDSRWVSGALPILAAFLHNVKELHITQMRWDLLDETARTGILSGFETVEALELHHVAFETLVETFAFIGSFPSLRDLSCDVVSWENDPCLTQEPPPPPPLHTLRLGSCCKSYFIQWFISEEPRIRTLELTTINKRQTKSIGDLLRGLGPNLEHLIIGLSYIEDATIEGVLTNDINLAHNTSLRSIHFDDMVIYDRSSSGLFLKWMSMILSQIISTEMDEIRFSFWLNEVTELDVVDWVQIQRILGDTRFSCVRRVTFVIFGQVDREKAGVSISSRVPALDERGIVHFR